jgi:hypothetical protein
MAAREFLRMVDAGPGRTGLVRSIAGSNNEQKAFILGLAPASTSRGAIRAETVADFLAVHDPLHIAEFRPAPFYRSKMKRLAEAGYLKVVGEDKEGKPTFRHTPLGDIAAKFGTRVLLAESKLAEEAVPMERVIGIANFGKTKAAHHRNPIGTRLPILHLLATRPNESIASEELHATSLLWGHTEQASQNNIRALEIAGILEKTVVHRRGCAVSSSYSFNAETHPGIPTFVDAYLNATRAIITGISDIDPLKAVEQVAAAGAVGILLKNAQEFSPLFGFTQHD